MLPKVESESLGLARSHGEQGHMPGNMQGKRYSLHVTLNLRHAPRGLSFMHTASLQEAKIRPVSLAETVAHLSVCLLLGTFHEHYINITLTLSL